MKKILITGGTVFVSRYAAEYYIAKGYDVYVLNRNSRPQPKSAKRSCNFSIFMIYADL